MLSFGFRTAYLHFGHHCCYALTPVSGLLSGHAAFLCIPSIRAIESSCPEPCQTVSEQLSHPTHIAGAAAQPPQFLHTCDTGLVKSKETIAFQPVSLLEEPPHPSLPQQQKRLAPDIAHHGGHRSYAQQIKQNLKPDTQFH